MGMMDEAWRESVKETEEQRLSRRADLTVEEVEQLKNEVESLKGDKVELRSIRGH